MQAHQPVPPIRRYWAVLAPLVVLLCTAAVLTTSSKPQALGEVLPPLSGPSPFRAYVFFQPADCASNLEFLRILARPKFQSTVAVAGMLTGADDDRVKDHATRRFSDLTGRDVVLSPTRKVAAALAALGYRTTPFLVVLDVHGQVRFAASVPTSFEASRSFERQLFELTRTPAVKASES
jgi:hypothetical protein